MGIFPRELKPPVQAARPASLLRSLLSINCIDLGHGKHPTSAILLQHHLGSLGCSRSCSGYHTQPLALQSVYRIASGMLCDGTLYMALLWLLRAMPSCTGYSTVRVHRDEQRARVVRTQSPIKELSQPCRQASNTIETGNAPMVVINMTKRDTETRAAYSASKHGRGRTLQRARLARDAHPRSTLGLFTEGVPDEDCLLSSTPPAWDNMQTPPPCSA